ncbi:solute carrier organic anion transporter family member 4A1 isoform X1 [Polypterus senegalus]
MRENTLSTDASFSSKQGLLDIGEGSDGFSLVTPSPVEADGSCKFSDGVSAGSVDILSSETTGDNTSPDFNKIGLVPQKTDDLCGWGGFRPKFIQWFNTPKWVLFFLCVASFLQGMIVNGFINTVITSIERRFDLRSYHSGLIASSYDIAACVCLTFVSYFGGTGHKPKWLGWGVLVMAVGSLVFALPHFVTDSYKVSSPEHTDLCFDVQNDTCNQSPSSLSNYRYMFMLGQFLHGFGATPLYTLGVTYLDENVKSNYAPVYIGIFYAAAIVGPAAGYLLGGVFLNIYSEINEVTELTPEDPLWVGAWWIGFLGGAAASMLVSIPILGYPRQLPGSQRYVAMRVSEAHQMKDGSHHEALDPQFGKTIKDLPRSVLLLLKNPTFIFLCFAGATEATLIAGMSTFGPKFLESQFNLSASEAATMFGYLLVPAGGGCTFLGGYIVKKLKLRCGGIIKFCLFCVIVSLIAIFIFMIHCPNVPAAGVTASYFDSFNQTIKLTSSCNSDCNCIREFYNPVCGEDKVMYYSPCHAGCNIINKTLSGNGKKVYSNCSCIVANLSSDYGTAYSEKCASSCPYMSLFLIALFVVISFTFLCSIPALTATLRCVPDSQRSFSLGIQWILVRTLGSIPGPIAFGSFIDISCLLWQEQCGVQGSCYLYENKAMSQYTLIVGLIYKALGTLFFFLAMVVYTPPAESPQNSSETNLKNGKSDLPVKDVPQELHQSVNTAL